jgi:hypothetical protein
MRLEQRQAISFVITLYKHFVDVGSPMLENYITTEI